MLVRFDSKAGTITMFGDVAAKLLRMMGQTGAVPGALLAADIPAAAARLRQAVAGESEKTVRREDRKDDAEPAVGLNQRAFPLIDLLERSAKSGADVIWDKEKRTMV
jgi:hypothetical protein